MNLVYSSEDSKLPKGSVSEKLRVQKSAVDMGDKHVSMYFTLSGGQNVK
jgi:hypothetical protein